MVGSMRRPPLECPRGPARGRRAAIAAALVALALAGCGHPATREECEELFTRTAEIELRAQKVTDAATIQKRTAEARSASGEEFTSKCLGKRITDEALACVRKA